MKPTKMPSKRKKNDARKAKSKSQDCCVTFKPKNYLEILLSAYAQTSYAYILYLNQKAVKCTTSLNGFVVSFSS